MQRASNSINSFLWARRPTSTHLNKGTITLVSTLPLEYIQLTLRKHFHQPKPHHIKLYKVVEKKCEQWPTLTSFLLGFSYDKKFRALTTLIWSRLGKSGIAKTKCLGLCLRRRVSQRSWYLSLS